MRVRTCNELGAFIRDRRNALGMDQAALAEKVAVSRKWVSEMERGKARAELGLVLRTLKALGVSIDLATTSHAPTQDANTCHESSAGFSPQVEAIDINSVLDALKKKP